MKLNITKESVGNAIKNGGGLLIGVALCTLPYLDSVKDIVESVRYYRGTVTYSDAVNAVLNSGMYSTDIDKVMDVIPKDGNTELYKTIIHVAKSNTYSSSKAKIIASICDEGEEA